MTEQTPPTGRDDRSPEKDPLDAPEVPDGTPGEDPPPDVPDILKQTTA